MLCVLLLSALTVQRTVQDTPRHCWCAIRAADRSCLEARQRRRHTNVSERPRYHLKGTALWRAQKPHPCSDCWQIPPQCLDGLMSTPKNGGSGVYIKHPDGDTTSLSVSGGLQCSNYRAEILAVCTTAKHLLESGKKHGKHHHLHWLPVNPSSPQLSWSRPDDPGPALLPCQADSSVHSIPPVGAYSCGTDMKRNSRQTCKNRQSGSGDTKPCHLQRGQDTSPLSVQWRLEERKRWIPDTPWLNLETGAGPADHYLPPAHRALWSECQSAEDWHFRHFPVWVRTSWLNPRPRPSVLPNIYRETSANMAAGCWSDDQAVGLGEQLDLWHQPDWRSDLHGCRSLKKKSAFTRLGHWSFQSVWWNARMHKLDLGLYSHMKEFLGNGVRTLVSSKEKNPL